MWKGWVQYPAKREKVYIAKHLHICLLFPPCLLVKLQIGKPVKQFNHVHTAAAPAKSGTGGKEQIVFEFMVVRYFRLKFASIQTTFSLNYFVEINCSGCMSIAQPIFSSVSFRDPGSAAPPLLAGET